MGTSGSGSERARAADGRAVVVVMLEIPATMVGDDVPTLTRKFEANAGALIPFLAEQVHRGLREPNVSPDVLADRLRRVARGEAP